MKNLELTPISFDEYIENDNDVTQIKLPENIAPTWEGNYILILNGRYPVQILETNSTAEELVQLWAKYQSDLPLDDLLLFLLQLDYLDYRKQINPIYPRCMDLILLVDALEKCKPIDNFENRLNKKVKLLRGLIESKKMNVISKRVEIYEKILSIKNEFYLAYLLNIVEPIRFTNDYGEADYEIINNNILVDAKINVKVDTTVAIPQKQLKIDYDNVLMLMVKHGYKQIEKSSGDQKANLVMVNLGLTMIGSILGNKSVKSNSFRRVFSKAISSAKKKIDGVIFYVIFRGNTDRAFFCHMRKDEVINLGRILDKIEIDLHKNSGLTLNTWDLLEIFQNLKDLNNKKDLVF